MFENDITVIITNFSLPLFTHPRRLIFSEFLIRLLKKDMRFTNNFLFFELVYVCFNVFESAPSLPNLDFDEFLHFHILSYSTKSKYTRKMYSYEKIHLPISIILSLFVYTWLYKHCPSNIGVRSHKVKNPWTKSTHFLAEIRKVVLMCFGNKRWRSTLSKYIESVSS